MINNRFYYSRLSAEEREIYKKIYEGILKLEKNIILPNTVDYDVICRIVKFVNLDNPLLYYVDFYELSAERSSTEYRLHLTFWYSQNDITILNNKVNSIFKKMAARIKGNNDLEIESSIHDLLVNNVGYYYQSLSDSKRYLPRANTILGVLLYKEAVCEGIAKVAKVLFNMFDIKCIVAVGTTKNGLGAHAWNIVKINNMPFHLDITWDISSSFDDIVCYRYFNLSDSRISADHTPNYKYPACIYDTYNYYIYNKLVAKGEGDIKRIIENCVRRGKKYIDFLIDTSDSKTNYYTNVAISYAMQITGRPIEYVFNNSIKNITIKLL